MQEELKQCNSIGTRTGIRFFTRTLLEKECWSFDALEARCGRLPQAEIKTRFAVLLFEDIGIIKLEEETVKLSSEGLLLSKMQEEAQYKKIGALSLEKLISEKMLDVNGLHYNQKNGCIIIGRGVIPLKFAVYRNFLVCIGGLTPIAGGWSIGEEFKELFIEHIQRERKIITQEELLLDLQRKQEDGEFAEQFAIRYEKERIRSQELSPRRISMIDVGAGYDIMSFNSAASRSFDRYIEVKAYRGKPHFFWSNNERRVAEIYNDKYFIYIINVLEAKSNPDTYEPIIIQDPYRRLEESGWLLTPNDYKATMIEISK